MWRKIKLRSSYDFDLRKYHNTKQSANKHFTTTTSFKFVL